MTNSTDTTVTETATATSAEAPKAKGKSKNKEPKPKREPKPKKETVGRYPFTTKKEIASRLASDNAFVKEALCLLQSFQTAGGDRDRSGFMSSHAAVAGALAAKASGEESLSAEETAQARGIVSKYTRQLAAHARRREIESNPELAKVAEVFSA